MSRALYLTDAYRREFDAVVVEADRAGTVFLDQTAFYPTGGGQPGDVGVLTGEGREPWTVLSTEKVEGRIAHRGDAAGAAPVGTRVRGEIDWSRRYAHMRLHTALHILSGVTHQRFGSAITGGQIYDDRARMDFTLPEFDRTLAESLIADANRVVAEDHRVDVEFVTRADASADPSLVRVAADLLPNVEEVRVIDIRGFDRQADGGTHVASTREVGRVNLERIENKGARNKRLYVSLGPAPPASGAP